MKNKGWIKLHRKLQECWIWCIEEPFDQRSAWVDLILSANHSDKKMLFNGSLITISRGQIMTSIRKLSDKWKWSTNKVYRFLKLLESDNMIHRESTKEKTLLTLINYEVYQVQENTNGNTEEHTLEYREDTPSNTPLNTGSEYKQEYKECIKNEEECLKNAECNTHTHDEPFDLDKNSYVIYRMWGNKNNFASVRVEWLNRFMGVPESNWKALANQIASAVTAYLDYYKEMHPDEKKEYQFLKSMDKFFQEDLDYWMAEVERRDKE